MIKKYAREYAENGLAIKHIQVIPLLASTKSTIV